MVDVNKILTPQILLVSVLAGWLNQEKQKILEYLREENRVLKVQLGGRLRLNDEQRRNVPKRSRGKTYHYLGTQQPSIGRALIRSESGKTPSS